MIGQDFEEHRVHLRGVAYRMLGSLSRPTTPSRRHGCGWTVPTQATSAICEPGDHCRRQDLSGHVACPQRAAGTAARRGLEPRISGSPSTLSIPTGGGACRFDRRGPTRHPADPVAGRTPRLRPARHVRPAVLGDRTHGRTVREHRRQLAARARRRVRGKAADATTDLVRQRRLVEAFLAAARDGEFDALLAVLDDNVVLNVDATAAGTPTTIRGAAAVATNARMFAANARFAEPALVDDAVGIIVAPAGRLALVLRFASAVSDHRDHHRRRPATAAPVQIRGPGLTCAHNAHVELLTGFGLATAAGLERLHPAAGARPAVAVHRLVRCRTAGPGWRTAG